MDERVKREPAVPAGTVKRETRHSPVRRSLIVGAAHDPAEREADDMADAVLVQLLRGRDPSPPVQGADGASKVRRGPTAPVTEDSDTAHGLARSPKIRRSAARVVGAEGGELDESTDRRIRASRGRGRPLPAPVRDRFGGAFGADFSGVRMHTGSEAADLNRSIQADAFTVGSDVFMGARAPVAGSPAGDRLLAHELSHVVQQSGVANRMTIRRAYVKGSAEKDLPLFSLLDPKVGNDSLGAAAAKAAKLGITTLNTAHYLERHTFKYQRLSGATTKQRAGMFPLATTAEQVRAMAIEAINKVPDGTTIGETVESVTVDLANGLKVNLGSLKGGKLSAFFPIAGTGFHFYEEGELNEIRKVKNA